MLEPIGIGKHRGKWVAVVKCEGERKRFSLGNIPAEKAHRDTALRAFDKFCQSLKEQTLDTIGEILDAYYADSTAVDLERIKYTIKRLKPYFGDSRPDQITRQGCRRYASQRRDDGVKDGTIRRELVTLRAALNWHDPQHKGVIELPEPPAAKDRWLTKAEFKKLLRTASQTPHLVVFLHTAIGTAARKEAIFQLLWENVDFDRGVISFIKKQGGKNRAEVIPMTPTLKAVLQSAHDVSTTDHVVEWNEKPVKSIRSAFNKACKRVGLDDVTPHTIRHTAATWMAMDGVPIKEIARYLGHSDPSVTWRIYAKYTPDYLKSASNSVDVGALAFQ